MSSKFYIMHRIEIDLEKGEVHLKPGYYKYIYDLSGEVENPCEYSSDREHWETCDTFKSFSDFQDFFDGVETFKIEIEDYVETISYRGFSVPIFVDDYGQCFYCIFNNKVLSFGSFQSEYEDEVRSLIDHDIEKHAKSR